jgi:hypothetical protein
MSVRQPRILAVGYELNYHSLKGQITNYIDTMVNEEKMEQHVGEYILNRMEHEKWAHLVGFYFSKDARGNPGSTKTKTELGQWFSKEYQDSLTKSDECYANYLHFTYSVKQYKVTHVSISGTIKGQPYVAVVFSTDKNSTGMIKKEIIKELKVTDESNIKHVRVKIEEGRTISAEPYIHYFYSTDSTYWPGELNHSLNHKIIKTAKDLTEFKKSCEGITKTKKKKVLDPRTKALLMSIKI